MFNWSEEQKKVIETRNADILVSAAAGSGKTAVLVERIARLICDEGVSLDELIVMTFTKAAAQEMRERVDKALHERLKADQDNAHIRTQLACMARARISTIDSLCQHLIKQYYQYLDIDPGFRVADEGELKIMQADIISALLEEKYEEASPAFMRLADTFSRKADDSGIAALIKALFSFAESKTFPKRFLEELSEEADRESSGEYESSEWFDYFMDYIRRSMNDYIELLEAAARICEEPDGPLKYAEDINNCIELAESIAAADSYEKLYAATEAASFARLPAARGGDPAAKELVKSFRNSFKDFITKKLKGELVILTPEELKKASAGSAAVNKTVTELTLQFAERFAAAKRDANIIDFADAEHFALELLYEEQNGKMVPGAIADELAEKLKEIMIDEYQDSNAVQDALLKALSAERFGRPDIFMVGDVKQSIYRFRKAEPRIFNEKYDSFGDSGEHIKIELNSNFRSRREVVYSVNAVFDRIMRRELGGVEYDEAARLNARAAFTDNLSADENGEPCSQCGTELLIADTAKLPKEEQPMPEGGAASDIDLSSLSDEAAEELASKELEFGMIAERINELISRTNPEKSFRVQEKDGTLRPARYGDIAILMRNVKSNAEQLAEILKANGIPAEYDRKNGYFETGEVDISLAMLNIIDNPHQDIPLASVMRSPMYGFTDDELALIKARYAERKAAEAATEAAEIAAELENATAAKEEATEEAAAADAYADAAEAEAGDKNAEAARDDSSSDTDSENCIDLRAESRDDFYNAVCCAAEHEPRVRAFTESLKHYRQLSGIMPVHRLLYRIYDETGYYNYVTAMPLGSVRRKNLDKLAQLAESYAGTGMKGLYNFTRYVEQLLKNRHDDGSAPDSAGAEDNVRIMTIHGSKGLEYPIVFLSRTGDSFSRKGREESDIMADNELGIASDYIDTELGLKYPSLKKAVLKLKNKEEDTGELQRLLYVAMTRAKEKLIVTGTKQGSVSKAGTETAAEKAADIAGRGSMLKSVLDKRGKLPKQVIAGLGNYLDMMLMAAGDDRRAFNIRVFDRAGLTESRKAVLCRELDTEIRIDAVNAALDTSSGGGYEEKLVRLFESHYAHEAETRLKPKLSVSELKEQAEEADSTNEYDADDGAEFEIGLMDDLVSDGISSRIGRDSISRSNSRTGKGCNKSSTSESSNGSNSTSNSNNSGNSGNSGAFEDDINGKMHSSKGGAGRGTAFHRAMQLLDYSLNTEENLQYLEKCGKMSESELKLLDRRAIKDFLETELAAHMREAAAEGSLRREQHFMIGVPARELKAEQDSDDLQLLQGIIDAYIEEKDGSISLIDYKTDRVQSEEELRERYRLQLELYARALTQLTGRTVARRIIYSTFMKRQIML